MWDIGVTTLAVENINISFPECVSVALDNR